MKSYPVQVPLNLNFIIMFTLQSVETKTFPADVISHAVAKRLVASVVK